MHRVGVKEEGVGGWGVGACNKKEERERERERLKVTEVQYGYA